MPVSSRWPIVQTDWFEKVFGFPEPRSWDETIEKFDYDPEKQGVLRTAAAQKGGTNEAREFHVGYFTRPSLGELRRRNEENMQAHHPGKSPDEDVEDNAAPADKVQPPKSCISSASLSTFQILTRQDVQALHNLDKHGNHFATFQVASQFNCLEQVDMGMYPELGVTRWAMDKTQGPACSLCTAPAVVVRNYFTGQSREKQIDNLEDLTRFVEQAAKNGSGTRGRGGDKASLFIPPAINQYPSSEHGTTSSCEGEQRERSASGEQEQAGENEGARGRKQGSQVEKNDDHDINSQYSQSENNSVSKSYTPISSVFSASKVSASKNSNRSSSPESKKAARPSAADDKDLEHKFWRVIAGYTKAESKGLCAVPWDKVDRELCKEKLRIGVHADTQVTACGDFGLTEYKSNDSEGSKKGNHLVTHCLSSACAISYNSSRTTKSDWEVLARIVLEASYEACFYAALETMKRHDGELGSKKLFLTLLGGGVFGNSSSWIYEAILLSLKKFKNCGLEVVLVSFAPMDDGLKKFEQQAQKILH
ncbi:unnamed protein product [Amoebophrya sp. A120]|nr:unnamed protein product [Amoebophrya sp. A120]|eukprot:GSA120T00016134001.1